MPAKSHFSKGPPPNNGKRLIVLNLVFYPKRSEELLFLAVYLLLYFLPLLIGEFQCLHFLDDHLVELILLPLHLEEFGVLPLYVVPG